VSWHRAAPSALVSGDSALCHSDEVCYLAPPLWGPLPVYD
jgi:hypothetical protein